MNEKEYVYALYDEGPFDYNSEEEAVAAELEDFDYEYDNNTTTIYRAEKIPQRAREFIWGCDIVDVIQRNAEDELGEYAEGWLTELAANNELRADLEAHIDTWFTKHGLQPTFYKVTNIEELEVSVSVTKAEEAHE